MTPSGAGSLEGVEHIAGRCVADGVHRNLKAAGDAPGDDAVEEAVRCEIEATLGRVVTIRGGEAGAARAQGPVVHDLHGAKREGAVKTADLGPPGKDGPERRLAGGRHRVDPDLEWPFPAEDPIRVEIGEFDSRVVDGGHTPLGVSGQRKAQPADPAGHSKRRHRPPYQLHGVVDEDTTRRARRVANDPPARGFRESRVMKRPVKVSVAYAKRSPRGTPAPASAASRRPRIRSPDPGAGWRFPSTTTSFRGDPGDTPST